MAMNTTMTTNIGQIERPTSISGTVTTHPNITPSSPFQPETQVDIENSIKSMLKMLSKADMSKGTPMQKMPEELQKLVDELLQNSFSVDSSLSRGLSNMLQSQRFTVEQLTILGKFVEQLSILADAEEIGNLPASMKTLLANLILLDGNEGKTLDSVNLTKLAFQLLEGKSLGDLPEALQFLLLQNPGNLDLPTQQSDGMNFLKQLVKFFLPQSSEGENSAPQGQGPNQTANQQTTQNPNTPSTLQNQTGQNQAANQPNLPNNGQGSSQPNTTGQNPPPAGNTAQGQTPQNQVAQGAQPGTGVNMQQNSNQNAAQNQAGQAGRHPGAETSTQPTGSQPSIPHGAPNSTGGQHMITQPGTNLAGNTVQGNQLASTNPSASEQQPTDTRLHSGNTAETPTVQTGTNTAGSPAIQNSSAMMQLMKNLAGLLMNKSSLTENQFNLLRNFVNRQQEVLDDQELTQLQTLLRMSEQNIPVAIRQAAARQNLPELPKLWAFVQLCNLSRLLDLPANRLRNASKNINDFASMLKKATQSENETNGNQRSISFMTPLYLGENDHCYPAYIHLYHENGDEAGASQGEEKKETWLRLCLMTEHIGAVELIFRLYEQENVNLRLSFSNEMVAESFQSYIPELESAFEALPLNLTDVKVLAIGE